MDRYAGYRHQRRRAKRMIRDERRVVSADFILRPLKFRMAGEFRDVPLSEYVSEVSRWLGHRSIEVTHRIYGHLMPSSFDRARTALDAAYESSRRQNR